MSKLKRIPYHAIKKNLFSLSTFMDNPSIETIAIQKSTIKDLELKLAELTDFVENTTLPLRRVNADGIITWANQAELDFLGYKKEEYIGQPITNFHADKELTVVDIAKIKIAEEKNGRLAAIIESSNDAIISKTFDSIVTSWNKSAQHMFGYSEDEIIGQSILKIIPQDRLNEEQVILARLKAGDRMEHFETKRITKDQRVIDVSLTISPVKDSEGTIIGISKIVRDITEKKQEDQRKNDFISMVSHELKTPLTSLSMLIQVTNKKLRTTHDPFLAGAMEKAILQVKKMGSIINGFLDVSRFESGNIALTKQHFEFSQLVKEVIEESQLTAPHHVITLSQYYPVPIFADRDKIGAVVTNLLNNAIKYSPNGKHINLSYVQSDGYIEVSVKDEGIGVKDEDIKKLFDRYYRVKTSHTQHIAGFGIGLYLCSEIVKEHHGNIWVKSEIGVGSTFYFSIPIGTELKNK